MRAPPNCPVCGDDRISPVKRARLPSRAFHPRDDMLAYRCSNAHILKAIPDHATGYVYLERQKRVEQSHARAVAAIERAKLVLERSGEVVREARKLREPR